MFYIEISKMSVYVFVSGKPDKSMYNFNGRDTGKL